MTLFILVVVLLLLVPFAILGSLLLASLMLSFVDWMGTRDKGDE